MIIGMKKLSVVLIVLVFLIACAGGAGVVETIPTGSPAETTVSVQLPVVEFPQLTRFHFFNENDGWGVTESQIVRTTDGGSQWYDATPDVPGQFGYAPYYFLDPLTIWTVLPAEDYLTGTLHHSADGGSTWQAQPVPFAHASLQFLDSLQGFALAALGAGAGSEAVALYSTTDGGTTWDRVFINDPTVPGANDSLPLGGQKHGFSFLDSARGWVGGSIPMDNYIYLYRTMDGGSTWNEVGLALPAGYESAQTGNSGPEFFQNGQGVLVVNLVMPADPGLATVVYRTEDGGESWLPGQVIPSGRPAHFINFLEGFAWGGGEFFVTHDAGQSWDSFMPGEDFTALLGSFEFINSQVGWVLTTNEASDPSLYKTIDGGASWILLIP